jgi:hypothetical protein
LVVGKLVEALLTNGEEEGDNDDVLTTLVVVAVVFRVPVESFVETGDVAFEGTFVAVKVFEAVAPTVFTLFVAEGDKETLVLTVDVFFTAESPIFVTFFNVVLGDNEALLTNGLVTEGDKETAATDGAEEGEANPEDVVEDNEETLFDFIKDSSFCCCSTSSGISLGVPSCNTNHQRMCGNGVEEERENKRK